jgi:hypothetical protein
MASLFGGIPYTKRAVPTPTADLSTWAGKLTAWLAVEFGNLSRRTAPASTRAVTGNTTVLATDGMILCNCTTAPIAVTWPTPIAATEDWVITILKTDVSANAVTVVGTVSGTVNPTLAAQYKSITIWSDGTVLYKIASV